MMPFGFLLDRSRRVALALSLCALAVVGSNALGQATPGQLQQAMQNPEVIRQRLMEWGLSADQIRARLRASGYPENLLDSYLGSGAVPAGVQPGTAELSAIQALGFGTLGATQQMDTGMIRWRGDTLVSKSNVFGVDVFRRSTTQFLPTLAGPIPPDYHLGPRDMLVLILTGDVEVAYTLQVTREGFVFIPQVGQVFVSSLTLDQLRDLLAASGGFRADAALQRVTVHRILAAAERGPGRAPRAAVDVALAVAPAAQAGSGQGTSYGTAALGAPGIRVPALALIDGDSVVIDSLPPLSETYYVAIAGRVNKPGRFPWRPGMTLRDLVQLARGPKIGAYLKEAEIARLPEDRSQGQLATTLRVPLDSTYLFQRTADGRFVGPPGVPVPASGAPEVS